MTRHNRRNLIRVTAIGVQWLCLTVALGSLVMRAERSFEELISPHLGAAPMFVGAFIAAFLLGMTVERPRYLIVLVLAMCVCAATAIAVLSYAPVVDGVLLRTTALDNYVAQRVLILTLLQLMAVGPGAAAGNLLGSFLNVRQEIMPHPEDLAREGEVPWWERRKRQRSEHQRLS